MVGMLPVGIHAVALDPWAKLAATVPIAAVLYLSVDRFLHEWLMASGRAARTADDD